VAIADLFRKVSNFISGHIFGETIQYRAWPGTRWVDIPAVPIRQPMDASGEFLRNVAILSVSKEYVTEWHITKDQVRLTTDKLAGEQAPVYTVMSARESTGHWILHCQKR